MKQFFTVGEAAKLVGMTAETLRHYDRIGLVCPHEADRWTGYRRYTEEELVKLAAVRALKCMDLPLKEIRRVLSLGNVEEIAAFLRTAERRADEKMDELRSAKEKMARARAFYEGKLSARAEGPVVKVLPARTILLLKAPLEPTVGTLFDYHRHFFAQLGEKKNAFSFEDAAGVYECGGERRMFAVCTRFAPDEDLATLPAGEYLSMVCSEETREETRERLLSEADGAGFLVEMVMLTGILQWNYEVQVPLLDAKA